MVWYLWSERNDQLKLLYNNQYNENTEEGTQIWEPQRLDLYSNFYGEVIKLGPHGSHASGKDKEIFVCKCGYIQLASKDQ